MTAAAIAGVPRSLFRLLIVEYFLVTRLCLVMRFPEGLLPLTNGEAELGNKVEDSPSPVIERPGLA